MGKCNREIIMEHHKKPKRARDCENLYGLFIYGGIAGNAKSNRITWCCTKRHGFLVKHWKCVGFENVNCPKNNGDSKNEE
jgi:hypothetical protein